MIWKDHQFVSVLFTIIILCLWTFQLVQCKDEVHLVLKNVNYHPSGGGTTDKKFDILDFSIYLPKTTNAPKSSLRSSATATPHKARLTNISSSKEKSPTRTLQSNYRQAQSTNTAPYFEALTGLAPKKLKSPYNTPFYSSVTGTFGPNQNGQNVKPLAIKLPNPSINNKSKFLQQQQYHHQHQQHQHQPHEHHHHTLHHHHHHHQQRQQKPIQAFLLPKQIHLTSKSPSSTPNPNNQGIKTEIIYGTTSNLPSYFEALTAIEPPVRTNYFQPTIPPPNRPYFEALTAVQPPTRANYIQPKPVIQSNQSPYFHHYTTTHSPAVIRPRNSPYFESHTTHSDDEIQNNQNNQHQVYHNVQDQDELIHHSPIKSLLLNNAIYHSDHYTNLDDMIRPNNEEDDNDDNSEDDNSYQVSEHPQESVKNYQRKHPSDRGTTPFVINVRDSPKLPSNHRPTYVTPVPQATDLSLASPISTGTESAAAGSGSRAASGIRTQNENLKDAKRQRGANSNRNPTAQAISDEIKYFQYANVQGPGHYNAGVKKGNRLHAIESHERALKDLGLFQKRVRWTDKNGGYGEHYWDLGHSKKKTS